MSVENPDDWYWVEKNERFVYIYGESSEFIAYANHKEGETEAPEINYLNNVGKTYGDVLKYMNMDSLTDNATGWDIDLKSGSDSTGNRVVLPVTTYIGCTTVRAETTLNVKSIDEKFGSLIGTQEISSVSVTFNVSMQVTDMYSDIFTSVAGDLEMYTSNKGNILSSMSYDLTPRPTRNEITPDKENHTFYSFYPRTFRFTIGNIYRNQISIRVNTNSANPFKGGGSFNTSYIKF